MTERSVLLDASQWILALDSRVPEHEGSIKAKERLKALLEDEDVTLAITPLIYHEVMRGITDEKRMKAIKEQLDALECFDIDREIAVLATATYKQLQRVSKEEPCQPITKDRLEKALDSAFTKVIANYCELEQPYPSHEISDLASKIGRHLSGIMGKGIKKSSIQKLSFDIFHHATAKCYRLEFAPDDKDFFKIEAAYQEII